MTSTVYADEDGENPKKGFFHPIIGRTWFSLLYFIAVGTTFAAIVGCWSPATQMFALDNTNTNQIISYLSNATSFNETRFQHPDLPDSWSWGFSGTCELYLDPSKDTKCYHAFPPLFSIQDLVVEALSNSHNPDPAATISNWNSALSAKPSDPAFSALANSDSQRVRSVSLLRGAAAAIVFSLLIGLSTFLLSVTLFFPSMEEKSRRRYRHILFGTAIFDALVFAAAISCFGYAMVVGPNVFASRESVGRSMNTVMAGYLVVLAALTCRVISIPVIGLVVLCILGFELLLIVLIGYLLLKFMRKMVENHQPVGI